jgi:hypothetical protein
MSPIAGIIVSIGLLAQSQGCAITMGSLYAATGEWPTSSSYESKAWVGGEPRRALTLEAHLSTPPRVLCDEHVWEPEALVTREDFGLDGGGRFAIGFIGVSEMAIGLIPLLVDEDPGAGAVIALGALALDGLVTLIMASTIPDTYKKSQSTALPREYHLTTCPPSVAFEARGRVLPVYEDGNVSHDDGRYLMEVVLSGEPVFGLRNGETLRRVDVPVEVQCDWATFLNHPAQRRVCPQRPVFVPVPVIPVRPPPIR